MRRVALWCAFLALVSPAWSDDDSVTRRLFVAASELEKSGQIEPARKSYTQIVETAPESEWADDALLALARLEWAVDDPAALGSEPRDPARLARAQELLETLVTRYVASDSAAEATWRLALLLLEPSHTGRNPDEAVARLVSLPTIYPDSANAPRALALAATIDEREGRDERARASAFELLSGWPARPECAEAWLVLGRIFAGERRWGDALHALGRAQAVAGSDSARGAEAARLATLVDRLAFRIAAPGAPLSPSAEGLLALSLRPDALALSEEGELALLYAREDTLERVSAAGERERAAAPGAESLAFDRSGGLWAAGSAIAPPRGSVSFAAQAGLEIGGIAPVDAARVWLLDEGERRVLLASRDGSILERASLPERARPEKIAPDGERGAWILDARARLLHRVDETGKTLTRIDLSTRVERPQDLAVDVLGNLYLLDEREKSLHVLDAMGTPLFQVALSEEGELGFERPEAIAVDGSGGVAVYDARKRRISWLR